MEEKNVSYEWDLSPLTQGKSFGGKRQEIWSKVESFESKWKGRQDYLDRPEVLKEALDDYEKLAANYLGEGDEGYYYILRSFQDKSDSEIKAGYRKSQDFAKKCNDKVRFFALNLAKVNEEKQKEFLESDLLKDYRHFLESLFEAGKYALGEEAERVMQLKSPVSYDNWADMTLEFIYGSEREVLDEEGNRVKKNFNELKNLLEVRDEKVRKEAMDAFEDILEKNEKVAETEINSLLENKKVDDELRGYERPDKETHVRDDIDSEVVDSLIGAVSENFDISRRFYELKAKLLGFEKFRYEERNINYGEISEKLDYENAKKIVKQTFSELDEEFLEIFEEFLENSRIDVFPRKGKEGGAMCVHCLKSQPVYVLLNHHDSAREVKTIAHEMGHAIHKELMYRNQNGLNVGSPVSTGEVASTFMEDFAFENLKSNVSEEEEFVLEFKTLEESMASIFRQICFYTFEQEIHEKYREEGYLSKESLGEAFANHVKKYLGDVFVKDEQMNKGWIYIPHFRYYFYTYSYASGILISKTLQDMVREDSSNVEKVKDFMKAGTSKPPKEIFSDLGIDISDKEFWEKGIQKVREDLENVEEKAKKLGKV